MGTHPIFESDFDCLTGCGAMSASRTADVVASMDNQEIDRAILATREGIQKEIEAERPLIGKRLPLSTLFKSFEGDELFTQKLKHLAEDYGEIVEIRPDGNCFYRAFAFALFEMILGKLDEINKLKNQMKKTKDFLIQKLNYPDVTVEDFYDQVIELMTDLQTVTQTADLNDRLSDPGMANYVI